MAEVTLEIHGARVVLVDPDMGVGPMIPLALMAATELMDQYQKINYPHKVKVACVTTENTVDND